MIDSGKRSRNKNFSQIGDILAKYKSSDEDKYISQEFQKYGYELARELSDLKHKALYIKLAQKEKRAHLETVRSFVKDARNVKNKGALFMWKLKEIKKKESK